MNVSELLLSLPPTPFPTLLPTAAIEAESDPVTVPETFCRPTSIT
jgi:hypothetical protein